MVHRWFCHWPNRALVFTGAAGGFAFGVESALAGRDLNAREPFTEALGFSSRYPSVYQGGCLMRFSGACLLAFTTVALVGCGPASTTQSPAKPTVRIISPTAGAVITAHSWSRQLLSVHLEISHFTLTTGPGRPGSGEVWIYVNGQVLARVASATTSLDLLPGAYTMKATLVTGGKVVAVSSPVALTISAANVPAVTTTQTFQMLTPSWGWKDGSLPNGTLWLATTGDGGKTWVNLPIPTIVVPYGGTVFFLNPSTGWILTTSAIPGTSQMDIVTYRTTDGGKFWSKSLLPAPSWMGEGGGIGNLLFANATDGWFTAGVAATEQGVTAIYRTTDSGRTWSMISVGTNLGPPMVPSPTPHALPALGGGPTVALSSSVAFATGAPYATATPLYLYRTTDGGVTWRPVSISLPASVPAASFDGTSTSTPVFSGSDGSLVLTLMGGLWRFASYTTTDSGQSWHFAGFAPITCNGSTLCHQLISFESPSTGIALGSSGLFQTTTGGRTWTRLQPSWLPTLMHRLPNVTQVQLIGNTLFALAQGPEMANGATGTIESFALAQASTIP